MGQINSFIQGAEDLQDFLDHTKKPCVIVLGSFNSGKSTLVNGLLGEEVSPVGVVPTTNCLVTFDYGHTFRASYLGDGKSLSFQQQEYLNSFLSGLKTNAGRVNIEHPSPLLKKCCLVDTPGIDGPCGAGRLAEQAAIGADQVIYLFHQRGIEDLNRLFLYKLADTWRKKDLSRLSFWLNCNYGLCDGSSLEATRTVLREIFLSPVKCNTINTRDPASLEVIKKFLQVELARDTCRQAYSHLKKLEKELPGRIQKIVKIKEESAFLSEFWRVKETSQVILEAGQLLQSLPAVAGELEQTLKTSDLANLGAGHKKAGGHVYHPKTTGVTEIRETLLTLTGDLLANKTVAGAIDLSAVEKAARAIQAERFTVVALGGFSTGKTTFFNALLKEDLLPTADGPTTTALTRITYGVNKKATVYFPLQITLSICERVGEKVGLYREQLQALERWLAPTSDVAKIEGAINGVYQALDRQEALKRIKEVKASFAGAVFTRTPGENRVPSIFRLISQKANKRNNVLDQVRITFKNAWSAEFNLSEQSEKEAFKKVLGPENAFRIEQVVIEYPSEFLKHTDFVDTPGLDWIQKHHYAKTFGLIRQSDAYLIFFNGKHILNQMDRQSLADLFNLPANGDFHMLTTREKGKYFFVVNFADTLSLSEREAVLNFVRRNLGAPAGVYAQTIKGPKIFLISALKALTDKDGGLMGSFLKALEEGILKCQAREFYLGKITELLGILDEASHRTTEVSRDRNTSAAVKVRLRKTQETLRESRRRLKAIRSAISPPKPP